MQQRRRNTESFTRAASDGRDWQHQAAQRGYQDATAGLGFSEWYGTATKDAQLAYEIGRQWATNMRAAGIDPPAWRTVAPPVAVHRANELAAKRGEAYATPWGVLADTDDPVLLEPDKLVARAIRRSGRGPWRRRRPAPAVRESAEMTAIKQLMRDSGMEFEGDAG